MRFEPAPLDGAYVVHMEPRSDARGTFSRAFCAREFASLGLETKFVQTNISTTVEPGTVRGLHFQRAPHQEVKLVRCVMGAIYDVIVDMREGSPTRWRWFGSELTDENGAALYVPRGFAHGFQALTGGATVLYQVSTFYAPEVEGGLRYDDPAIEINWPLAMADLSGKDATWPWISLLPTDRLI
jgi:dTDP-4-dehydrorhamnose 3,5-epimerase